MFAIVPLVIAIMALSAGGAIAVGNSKSEQARASTKHQPTEPSDPIVESFERELNHQPGPNPPARRESIDEDWLYVEFPRALQANENSVAQNADAPEKE